MARGGLPDSLGYKVPQIARPVLDKPANFDEARPRSGNTVFFKRWDGSAAKKGGGLRGVEKRFVGRDFGGHYLTPSMIACLELD
jgi:hypothetical protein